MAGSLLSESTLAERDMALVLREVELNRRESALRRAEEALVEEPSPAAGSFALEAALEARLAEVELRDRELQGAVEAVESQRARLEEVRQEYESRLDALIVRTREVELERNRLRDEQAQLVCASLALEEREQAVETATTGAITPVEVTVHDVTPERADTDWWSRQLGSPLEAA